MKKELIIVLLLALVGAMGFAQTTSTQTVALTVPSVAMLGNNGPSTMSLALRQPALPGEAPQDSLPYTSAYLRYSSVVAESATRSISVQMASGIPAGTALSVAAIVPSGMGTASAPVTLATTSAPLITAISTCFTGTGPTDGANLSYVFKVVTPGSLRFAENTPLTVTYTISE